MYNSVKTKCAARDFPVVCVGGGLDAYIRLLQNLPADLGGAIVIVNHLRIAHSIYWHLYLFKWYTM